MAGVCGRGAVGLLHTLLGSLVSPFWVQAEVEIEPNQPQNVPVPAPQRFPQTPGEVVQQQGDWAMLTYYTQSRADVFLDRANFGENNEGCIDGKWKTLLWLRPCPSATQVVPSGTRDHLPPFF